MSANPTGPLGDEILTLIFEAVNLKHIDRAEVKPQTALMKDGLGLDSIDILEIVIALEKKYNVKIASSETGRKIFKDFGTLTAYIEQSLQTQ